MKTSVYAALVGVVACALLIGCERPVNAEDSTIKQNDNKIALNAALNSDAEKASYLIGFNQAAALQQQTSDAVNPEAYVAGIQDALAGSANQLAGADEQAVFTAFQAEISARQRAKFADVEAAGKVFRDSFAAQPGVVSLESGLLYEVMIAGEGAKPSAADRVTTHYHGTLIDGTVFDSSVERNSPASFAVNGVIPGWTEALQLMPVGSKWKLVIPPELAYGESGAGGAIGPQSTLVFEVELLSID
ncbi:MAG: FKBP-type peptidyl-prolyl cis-trans isomerase [Pseudomonadota bacterium]